MCIRRNDPFVLVALAVVIALFAPAEALAQTQNGNIVGTVRDATGGVIQGATIVLEQQETRATRTTTTAEDGTYRFALVPLGTYRISVEHTGFKRYVDENVVLSTNQTLRVDIALAVGQTTEQITVTAQSAAITTDTAEIASAKTEDFLSHHPSLLFNPGHLVAAATISSTESFFSYYGSRRQQAATTVDGAQFNYANNYVMNSSLQEVKAEALLAPAKYQTPVTVNAVTKQGTNDLHGRLDLTIYNNYFKAQNPRTHVEKCSTGRPCTGFWTSAISVSGPAFLPKIYDGRNKTFWMFTVTPRKNYRWAEPVTNTVPNEALRAGDLSGLSGQIKNPFTDQPFPNNKIPASMINPVSAKLLNLYPQPDVPGGTVATFTSKSLDDTRRTWSSRLDQKISEKNWAMFSLTRHNEFSTSDLGGRSVKDYMGFARGQWLTGTYVFADTHIFNPNVVNEARFGVSWEGPTGYTPLGIDVRERIQQLGLTNISEPRVNLPVSGPQITIPGFTPFLGRSADDNRDRFYHISDNLSIQHGRHAFQTGFEIKYVDSNHASASATVWPEYSFDGRFTGNGYGDFLLGLPGQIYRENQRPVIAGRRRVWGAYLQDDWRVTEKLTLNLGIRYDYLGAQWEANDLYFTFSPKTGTLVVPNERSLGGIDSAWNLQRNPVLTANQAGYPERLTKPDRNNAFPRIGFAYRPFNNQHTVIRGGYGIYIVPDQETSTNSLLQTGGPFGLYTVFDNALAGGQPLLQWPVGFPSEGATYRGIPSVTGISPDWVYPYTQQWNLSIEKSVFGQGIRLSYIGTKDTKLGYRRDINKPYPSTTPFSAARYNWPSYRTVTYVENGGSGTYHGFEANLRTRGVFGIRGEFGYSWAKQMTDVPNGSTETIIGNSIENPYCRTCERARSELVPKHRLFAGYTWDLPFGKGRQLARDLPAPINAVIGNWMITSTVRARTGLGFTPTFSGSDPSNTNTFGGRPDVVGNPELPAGERSPDRWYNPKGFAVPPANSGRFGTAGRNILDGPGFFMMNLGVYKFIPVKERLRMVLSMTSDNVLNKVNYGLGRAGSLRTPAINAANAGRLDSLAEDFSTRAENQMRFLYFSVGFEF